MGQRMVSARELVGRRIVGFEPNVTTEGRTTHDPVIRLDDGSSLYFMVEESENGYGVFIGRRKTEPSEGARRAQLRPSNYNELSASEQWEIDKQLGILDWDGK